MSDVVIILGSPFHPSRTSGLIDFAIQQIEQKGESVKKIIVRDIPPADLVYANFKSQIVEKYNEEIREAKAVIVGTPVYKASYTGLLKIYLDLLPQDILENKVVLPIVTGGTFGHLLTIEYALKPLLSALGATHILKGVFSLDQQLSWTEDETIEIEVEVKERVVKSIDQLLENAK